jgi:membrane protein required for colicin V production
VEWLAPSGGWNAWDAALLAVVLLSTLVGLFRGFVLEVLSLLGWFVAVVAAIVFAPDVAAWLPVGEPGSRMRDIAALVALFLVVLVVWGILARLLSRLIGKTPLRPLDRLLGMAFGFARAALVLLALTAVLLATPIARSDGWRQSTGARWLEAALADIAPLLPFDLPRRMAPPPAASSSKTRT